MKTILMLASVGLMASLAGCVGGLDVPQMTTDPLATPDGDGNDNGDNPVGADLSAAKALFDSGVYTVISAKCSTGACHQQAGAGGSITKFVATDASEGWQIATNYGALVGTFDAASAPILNKIAGGHQNVTPYTAAEKTAITSWLNKEIELRNGQEGGTSPTAPETLGAASERVTNAFASCMNITDFQTADMANKWGNKGSNEGPCKTCHVNGGYGFIASDDEGRFFNRVTTNKWEFLQYFTANLTMGAAAATMEVNRVSFNGVSQNKDPHREHPRFNSTDNDQAIQALQQFYTLTMARVTAGGCTPRILQTQ